MSKMTQIAMEFNMLMCSNNTEVRRLRDLTAPCIYLSGTRFQRVTLIGAHRFEIFADSPKT